MKTALTILNEYLKLKRVRKDGYGYFFGTEENLIRAMEEYAEQVKNNFIKPNVSNSYCPKGCKGLCYTHDDRITQSCCECGETWAI